MCESTVYKKNRDRIEPYFKHLERLDVEKETLKMTDLFGESETVRGKVKKFSLVEHKVIIESLPA